MIQKERAKSGHIRNKNKFEEDRLRKLQEETENKKDYYET